MSNDSPLNRLRSLLDGQLPGVSGERIDALVAEALAAARAVVLDDTTLARPLDREDGPRVPPGLQEFVARRYTDEGLLGIGGMGEVRRVRDTQLGRVVAMKVLRSDLVTHDWAKVRFIEEAQATAQLQHPGIVPVHDLGVLPDGRPYFTMKEVTGATFDEALRLTHLPVPGPADDQGPWTLRRLVEVFRRICEAVSYAHSRGVLHRDLKPANIMLGPFGEVLVLDWGLVKGAKPCSSASPDEPWDRHQSFGQREHGDAGRRCHWDPSVHVTGASPGRGRSVGCPV
jgi:serine/threonine protein kinase